MKMFYYGSTQCLSQTFRGDQCKQGIPIIGHEQPPIQVDPVNMADPLDVTIPIEIRKALNIEPGDLVAYEIQGQSVKIKRITPFDAAFHSAVSETLEEWNSPDDEEAFNDL